MASNGRFQRPWTIHTPGQVLSFDAARLAAASDWVLPFDLALPKVTCYRKLTLVSLVASDRFTSELDVRGGRPFECQLLTASNSRTRPVVGTRVGVPNVGSAAGPAVRGRPLDSRSRLLSGLSGTQAIAAPTTGLKVLQT